MTTSLAPDVKYTKEVRFAVVMYGGVSLAIYINGVAQELLRMVRATADDNAGKARVANKDLSGSERVYRKLSHLVAPDADADSTSQIDPLAPIPTRFVVDTITGASAGGINGIFLAKALVRGQTIDSLQDLWVREGAIEKLLNDRLSKDPPAVSFDNPPTALLNAKRMYFELLKAFDGMDGLTAANTEGQPSDPLVDELDLFVTTTDLHGAILPMRLTDEVVFERRHKNVFHFVFPRDDDARDADFVPETNPFLAYAARCTSSFPFAFEPMTLTDIDPILNSYDVYENQEELRADNKSWKRFFHDYEQAAGIKHVLPSRRAFADGGDLDNKPFGYAIDTLSKRHADHPVARKLLYVEPAPDHPEFESEKDEKPNVVENALDALSTLPMYETIREDLKRVNERNRLVVRVNRVLENVDRDVDKALASDGAGVNVQRTIDENHDVLAALNDDVWSTLYLDDMIKRKGRGYTAYHRLEIGSVTDDLARLVTRGAGLNEDSDYFAVNRSLTRAWRGLRYIDHRQDATTEAREPATFPRRPINQFLTEFNLAYPIRRISFLRNRIEFLLCLDIKELQETYKWAKGFVLTTDHLREFRDELRSIYRALKQPESEIRKTGRRLSSRPKPGAPDLQRKQYENLSELRGLLILACAAKLKEDGREDLVVQKDGKFDVMVVLNYFLRGTKHTVCDSPEAQIDRQAKKLLDAPAGKDVLAKMNEIAAAIADQVRIARKSADDDCRRILGFGTDGVNKGDDPRRMARECLQNYYQNYDDYDMIIFPIVFETEVGEPALVDVFRVSPEDAKALIDEKATKCRKLAGTALAHFGAFLEKRWRQNDILWGRLDGAERIISAVLPIDHPQKESLIREAQAEIVAETIERMPDEERNDLLAEAAMRTNSGQAEPNLLVSLDPKKNPGFVDNLKKVDPDLKARLDASISNTALRQHYLNVFANNSRPDPESTLKTVARATTITGRIFEKLADDYATEGKKAAAWITRLGLILLGLVELAAPHSIWNLLSRYWLKLLYLIELIMIVFGTVLVWQPVQQFGFLFFALTVAVHVALTLLNDIMRSRNRWLKLLGALGIGLLVVVIAIGLFSIVGLSGQPWTWRRMSDVNGWFTRASTVRKWFPVAVVGVFLLISIRADFRRERRPVEASEELQS
jgi:patatin-related protein